MSSTLASTAVSLRGHVRAPLRLCFYPHLLPRLLLLRPNSRPCPTKGRRLNSTCCRGLIRLAATA
eukprot:2612671-Pleurochrysis_carterae.AAC.1